jgi:alpha-beta hydrolase superfamily lysophospholipase
VGIIGARGADGMLDDIDQVITMAADAVGSRPIILLGHSMGSLYSLRYSEIHGNKIAGLILSGPVGVIPTVDDMIASVTAAVERGAGDQPVLALSPFNTAFAPERTPYDWLSRDIAEVDAYINDPMCGDQAPLTYSFLLANLMVARGGIRQVDDVNRHCPVLIVSGESDPVSGFGTQARELGRELRERGVSVTERYYPDARHEILNETNRDEVVADIDAGFVTRSRGTAPDVELG